MKERQRWQAEEDALLHAYVRQYGPREWHLVSQRMHSPLNRNANACLERWKNYLKPDIKKGSLTEEEQHLVICLQAKHENKWKKIAAKVPGRTAKRLCKWGEVFKEKQQKEQKENTKIIGPAEEGKYNHILETFAEKLVKKHSVQGFLMATSNGHFVHTDPPAPSTPTLLPPWLSSSTAITPVRAPSPSVTLSLSPSVVPPPPPPGVPWLQPDRATDNNTSVLNSLPCHGLVPPPGEKALISELLECCKELEEKQRAWATHKKEAAWRLRRVELQVESENSCKRREKMEEIEAKVKALREEQKATLDRIEAEYREQLAGLRRDAEAKEQKLAEQWAAKHSRLTTFLEQMGCQPKFIEPNG